ncbi:hypothetical protein DIE14_22010 [Burkholderia sp. Bp9017]|uniref:hypothetical protein n=1 Tax=unclassified Burkholderia TaxID=2613784 RepID=UPI000F5EB01D|nr:MULTISPECIES: hypothetical protein [unclassified Burkholderia]RQZ24186.1 hypothetical protein DIE14_22010 [Burkholderia sp. Bp9017]RQZ32156.1 hypothetical protein DIE13_21890 [Burkholderia sp. Bp9016]
MTENKIHVTSGNAEYLQDETGDRRYWPIAALAERDAAKPSEQQGLFRKFDVRRVDGSDQPGGKHHGCEYFVLDLDCDQHAPAAMLAYARSCADTHPKLSANILSRLNAGDAPDVDQTPAAAPMSTLRALIADSAHAATFQTMGQYRAALLAGIDDGRLRSSSDYVFQLACGRIQAALAHLGAALASFPKSASEACVEQAVRILQGRYAIGGIVAGESSDQVPAILSPRREYFIDEGKAARTGVYQYRDTGSLETGDAE